MTQVARVSPEEIYPKIKTGEALLVCAYDDEHKFRAYHLDGAISLNEFRQKLPSLSPGREIVLY
ncbi:MAG: ArsR family transcriptional regulator [Deltaproteobacteria bacterium]|nr:ArsR family transcriptional regulator [Deltaproteobacteria bacterium]